METLSDISRMTTIPIVVIEGIGKHNAAQFSKKDIDGLAVVSAIIAEKDIAAAAKELKRLFIEGCENEF